MIIGTIKSYEPEKGWGFIASPQDGEIFVHTKGIEKSSRSLIKAGVKVGFVVIPSMKGFQAAHVRVISTED
ncbi:cold-shock protein [uncultured Limosilactobacillus sp.]|uniref:cold-shock protein n=1 Tax=uncultured Limosilactobacillus sp. TaxID=2837629 RepID=UPI0025DBA102|nr:cold shock domain-containing protein [uncultured Limosilactobacillus sp.]